MSDANQSISVRPFLVRLFVAAFVMNWIWEIAQISFYAESGKSWLVKILGCTSAAVGDALLTLLAYGFGALVTRNWRWGISGGWKIYLTMALCGAVFAVIIEWIAKVSGHWSYNERMPIMPFLQIGWLPFLQLTILLPAALRLAMWRHKRKEKEMKKTNLMLAVVAIAVVALILAGCQRNMMQSDNANVNNANASGDMMNGMMNNPQQREMMMQMMMNDPEMMRQMMDKMMSDPQMMDKMMSNPKMTVMMTRYMTENGDKMAKQMESMMNNPEHRKAMIEMMRRNPPMREQMRSVIDEANKPAAK